MTKEAFEAHIDAQRSRLLALARTKLPESDCEDAVQGAILAAWKHLPQLKDEAKFDAWIRQILLNECMQILRDKRRVVKAVDAMMETVKTPQAEEDSRLNDAIDAMNPSERALLLLHHDQGYSVREIAHTLGASEDAVKMRLYRARNNLRILLISLLLFLLGIAVAVGTGYRDIPWFMENRRAEPTESNTDHRSAAQMTCGSLFLAGEMTDAMWNLDTLELSITYSLTGTQESGLVTHSGNIGVDGLRQDHIWIGGEILAVAAWADGKTVYTYSLDGWRIEGRFMTGSEDYLPDDMGDSFLACLRLDSITPQQYEALLSENGMLKLENDIFVCNYATGEVVERAVLTALIAAPPIAEWRNAYEAYHR